MQQKFTYDADVVRTWSRNCATYKRQTWWVLPATVLIMVGPIVLCVVFGASYFIPAFAAFVVGFLAIGVYVGFKTPLLFCPHCGKRPLRWALAARRGSEALSVYHCEHCLYWLREPPPEVTLESLPHFSACWVARLLRLPFPWLHVIEALIFPLLPSGFFAAISFAAAEPVATLDLHGKSLPSGWEAAVSHRGSYYPWYRAADHPVLFVADLVAMVVAVAVLRQVETAQVLQSRQAGASKTAHAIARACVIAECLLLFYWFFLVGPTGVQPS